MNLRYKAINRKVKTLKDFERENKARKVEERKEMKTINTSRNIYLQETHFNKYDIIKANENRMDFNIGTKK